MSYLVLARKWRPKVFADVVGQAHVVRALQNALAADRVHHAYLFAGTRGVGKTTIARILAKALNCREGVAAEPCGQCAACLALDEGRFVDLIEVDAASRTGVDDTRELLENVLYAPTSGRYKVYLIDEVHMLSRQSFNALLKTLEEPPPHVKFLFATTDPQKLPITVLSRCLQFNLKRLPAALIDERMREICVAEGVDAEPAALTRLARAANGSVRDALSLLDQALAYGAQSLVDSDVAAMLGSMDRHSVLSLLDSLADGDAAGLLEQVRTLDEDVPDYERVLEELATALQRVAVIQLAGASALENEDELADLERLAASMDPAQVQLYYQLAITSRRDLALAPDPRLGFEMALLRLLAFRLGDSDAAAVQDASPAAAAPARRPAARPPSPARATSAPASRSKPVPTKVRPAAARVDVTDWPAFVAALPVTGAPRQLAENAALDSASDFELQLRVAPINRHLVTDKLVERLTAAVQKYQGTAIKLRITVGEEPGETLAAQQERASEVRREQARKSIEEDPAVQQMVDIFGAEIVPGSVRPGND